MLDSVGKKVWKTIQEGNENNTRFFYYYPGNQRGRIDSFDRKNKAYNRWIRNLNRSSYRHKTSIWIEPCLKTLTCIKFFYPGITDFRIGIYDLCKLIGNDTNLGSIYIFANKRLSSIKVIEIEENAV